jgi:Glycosyltransferases, probably involved in cell wall biogenesis
MDATPDHSVQNVLKSYHDILHYSRHGPDLGQSAAILEGWEHTDSDIVAWLCADDYYFPYTFEEVEKIFTSRPDVDVIYGDSVFIDQDGRFLSYYAGTNSDISLILRSCCISQPSCFVRREVLKRMGTVDPNLHYTMDWDLWTRLYKGGAKFYYICKPLSVVRICPETKTASRSRRRYAEINEHLKANVNLYTRIRTLLGSYYYDLSLQRISLMDEIVFCGLKVLLSIKGFFRKYYPSRRNMLYGFERGTNRVHGECDIFLPWYGDRPPRRMIVLCTDARNIEFYINGNRRNIASVSRAEGGHMYIVNISDFVSNLLHLRFVSLSGEPWQLLSLELLC